MSDHRLREYLDKNGLPETAELPDDLRVPLHSLQADLDWLFSRRDEGADVQQMLKESVRNRLSQIEEAAYRLNALEAELAIATSERKQWADAAHWSREQLTLAIAHCDELREAAATCNEERNGWIDGFAALQKTLADAEYVRDVNAADCDAALSQRDRAVEAEREACVAIVRQVRKPVEWERELCDEIERRIRARSIIAEIKEKK